MFSFLAFFCLSGSFLSLWIRRSPKIWGSLLSLSILFGTLAGHMLPVGIFLLAGLIILWLFYVKKPLFALLLVLVIFTLYFKLRLLPGYRPFFITSKFQIGLEGAIIGLLPLALLVPLSKTLQDWKKAAYGLLLGLAGIGILAVLATLVGATHWNLKIPNFMPIRMWSNLILVSIPEEAFYRGFVQRELCRYLPATRSGKITSLVLTSILFTFAHIYWSPDATILVFVFLASLLYGTVYLISGKIESAILTHFLLNLIHMTFFEYHAM